MTFAGAQELTFATVIADVTQGLLGVSALGIIGKLAYSQSWLFRSHARKKVQTPALELKSGGSSDFTNVTVISGGSAALEWTAG
jgi:hypothetical protein